MSDQIPVYRATVRYPGWEDALDEHERPFTEQSWETDTPVIATPPQSEALDAKLAHLEWLRADNERDTHPSFERLAGADAARSRSEPRRHSWLAMALWPIAALCVVGLVFAVIG